MEVMNLDELNVRKEELTKRIKEGEIFIYPTDTIYGIGCDATNREAVARIREIKIRYDKPFSVIAPSKEWIAENCIMTKEVEEWISRLPGPYTIILDLKKQCVAREVNLHMTTLGIRIPKHPFSKFVTGLGIPIVTTSVNRTGQAYMTNEEDLDLNIRKCISFMVYVGEKSGKPSQIVNLATKKTMVTSR